MQTLRLTQSSVTSSIYRVEVTLEGAGLLRRTAATESDFAVTPQEREDLRWYLEDYLQHVSDPAPKIAARIERRIFELGGGLFRALFQSNDDVRDIWAGLHDHMSDTRIEIVTGVRNAAPLPWELLYDPQTKTFLAVGARAFVRTTQRAALNARPVKVVAGPIRILLVICRPGGRADVPFRSVASRLIKGLDGNARAAFHLDVLRPPTFERLGQVLRAAKNAGAPYHIVHFDGHGIYTDLYAAGAGRPPVKMRGYLTFENPALQNNVELIHGTFLGSLLAKTEVPILVLNACRSAHAEAPPEPTATATTGADRSGSPSTAPRDAVSQDAHVRVRAFGSLAQEVVDAGVPGVVAMRYNVYVITAAQFVANLYEALARGHALSEAVTLGRRQLREQPLREIAYRPRPLQDWIVPAVYEAEPVVLFPRTAEKAQSTVYLSAGRALSGTGAPTPELKKRPDAGFFGRDETLLAIDRAFDIKNVVLLHAYAGSGKTSTAAEFARWYQSTGGINGPALFTSFERFKPLASALNDAIDPAFGNELERSGIQWHALTNKERGDEALRLMARNPLLWIWDNVELVAGFPSGTRSAWSDAQQGELADFLRAAQHTKAKILLLSRRDERGWLGDLPARITMPPMPMQERVQLTRALAEKHGRRLTEVEDWLPLLRFTVGNPLAITVLVGQCLLDGLKTREQVEEFVDRLRTGEAKFNDEASEGRSKSLGASLSYGFDNAFSEDQRRRLALLYFFQGFVDAAALAVMGEPESEWGLAELRGLTSDESSALLDRAAEVGLLTAHGAGFYSIHPALPWFFKRLFDQYYPDARRATQAFVETVWRAGSLSAQSYTAGKSDVITYLSHDQFNILNALQLARENGWEPGIIGTMQALDVLYEHTGRRAEWSALLNEVAADFVKPKTDAPLPGRERGWFFINDSRVGFAREARRLDEAERLQHIGIDLARRQAAAALAVAPDALDDTQRESIRTLINSLNLLGKIQIERREPESLTVCEEAFTLAERFGERFMAAVAATNIGAAHLKIPSLRDLAKAELWLRRSVGLHDEEDARGRAQLFTLLGRVAYERYMEAYAEGRADERLADLSSALKFYQSALRLTTPTGEVAPLGLIHHQLGTIYYFMGQDNLSLAHFRYSIRYAEMEDDIHGAAVTRLFIAGILTKHGRLADAQAYASAGLSNFETFGDRAAEEIQKSREMLGEIERKLQQP